MKSDATVLIENWQSLSLKRSQKNTHLVPLSEVGYYFFLSSLKGKNFTESESKQISQAALSKLDQIARRSQAPSSTASAVFSFAQGYITRFVLPLLLGTYLAI